MLTPDYWDEKHLMCFLYLSVAASEPKINPNELQVLNQKLDTLLKDRYHLSDIAKAEIMSSVQYSFYTNTADNRMQMIDSLSKKITLDVDTYQFLLTELYEIAHSDNFISIEEHSMMFYVRLKFKKDYPSRTQLNYALA